MIALLLAASILVFNEDDSNYIRDVPKEEFVRYFDSVCRGAVTHFFMCPNAMRSNVESKFLEPIWTALDEPGVDPDCDYADWAKRIHAVNPSVTVVPGLDSGVRSPPEPATSCWALPRRRSTKPC